MSVMESDNYRRLVYDTALLIKAELAHAKLLYDTEQKDPTHTYAQGLVMLEFFKHLRGEAFYDSQVRPSTPGFQENYYKLEDDIKIKLEELRKTNSIKFEKVKTYLDEVSNNWIK